LIEAEVVAYMRAHEPRKKRDLDGGKLCFKGHSVHIDEDLVSIDR